MKIAMVKYGKALDWKKALNCWRCQGTGNDRYDNAIKCKRCDGTGIKPEGWSYNVGNLELEVGDLVELPPTPYSEGKNCVGRVTFVGFVPDSVSRATKSVIRKVEETIG